MCFFIVSCNQVIILRVNGLQYTYTLYTVIQFCVAEVKPKLDSFSQLQHTALILFAYASITVLFNFLADVCKLHNHKKARQSDYQIDVTQLRPPECMQASCHIRQTVCLKSDFTLVDNGREATQHPPISCRCCMIIHLQYQEIFHNLCPHKSMCKQL